MATLVCAGASHGMAGERGLQGAGVGAGIGFVLCSVSYAMTCWVRRARGPAIVTAVFGSTISSFVLMLVAILLVSRYWNELLFPAALTALFIYLSFRFFDIFQTARQLNTGRSRSERGGSGNPQGGNGASGPMESPP